MAKYLLIGNSTAAIGAAEGIRQVDPDGSMLMIASEPHHTYSRPLISYLLLGATDLERMKYRPDDFYTRNQIETRFGETVTAIDPVKKEVVLSDNSKVSYEKLFLGTGSNPFDPPMKGLDTVEKKFHFMTLDQAQALQQALSPTDKVLIVGAGLIGLKCAEGIRGLCGSLSVVDLAPQILPSILDADAAAVVQEHLAAQGIDFYLGQSVQEFKNGVALLTTGEQLQYDVVVIAVGVRPNTALLKDAGGKVGRGITVNEKGETSLPDIYAAGDCVELYDISTKAVRPLAILPNAYLLGEVCGKNMAGSDEALTDALPVNAIGFFGLHMVTAGSYTGESRVVKTENGFRKFFIENDQLKGFIIVGDVSRSGIYTDLIRRQVKLSELDFDLLAEYPSLAAFKREYRDQILGGQKA